MARKRLAEFECREPVFREAVVKERGYVDGGRAELFLLLDEVGAADESNCHFVAQGGEQGEHFGFDALWEVLCVSYWQL